MLSFNRQFWKNPDFILFVVACVVLGLSIWALVAKCPEKFGSSCLPIKVSNRSEICKSANLPANISHTCAAAKKNPNSCKDELGFVNCFGVKGTSCSENLGDEYSTGCYIVGQAEETFGEGNVTNCP